MPNVLVTGYFDRGNYGDDLMLDGLLRLTGPDVDVAALPALRLRGLAGLPRFVARMARADHVVVAGGTHLTSEHARRRRVLAAHAVLFGVVARLVGTRVTWRSVGLGPLDDGIDRLLARVALAGATVVTRDTASAATAATLGIEVEPAEDLAWAALRSVTDTGRGGGVVVNVAAPAGSAPPGPDRLRRFLPADRTPTILVLCDAAPPNDATWSAALPGSWPRVQHGADWRRCHDVIAAADHVLVSRFHGTISALAAGRTGFVLPYAQKVQQLAEERGLERIDGLDWYGRPVYALPGSPGVDAGERVDAASVRGRA